MVSAEDAELFDRGKGTMIDAIDPAQLRSIADIFWGGDSHSFLKIRTDLLLCYAFTCRGDNSRNLKISTVGYFTFKLGVKYFPDVGVNGIYILRSVWRDAHCGASTV
jgi:hypothetical protein